MKKLLLFLTLFTASISFSQVTIWQEDFENSCTSGCSAAGVNTGNGAWTLTDNSPSQDGCGFTNTPNTFYVSCAENGNDAGQCGTTCSNDESLHVSAQTTGDLGAAYDSGGWCEFGLGGFGDGTTTNVRAESPTIDLTGESNISIEFVYMEGGEALDDDASLWYYDGSAWSQINALAKTAMCGAQGTWTAFNVTLPASADNNPNVKIGFLWVNDDDASGSDPSFAVDDIKLTVPGGNAITASSASLNEWCYGSDQALDVTFNAQGTYTAGNIFTAELSDAAGSFASPTTIGTLASTASGVQTINGTVLGTTPVGTGYRVRVLSSNPVVVGGDNGLDLTIHDLPTVTMNSIADMCENESAISLSGGSPGGGTYSGNGVSSNIFNPTTAGEGTHTITYTYTNGNGCSNSASEDIVVFAAPNVVLASYDTICSINSSFGLSGGIPNGGSYSGNGVSAGVFDPGTAGPGIHVITYSYTDGNGCSGTASSDMVVLDCTELNENEEVKVSVFPNPTDGEINILSEDKITSLQIIDMLGRTVLEMEGKNKIDIHSLNSGTYLLQINIDGLIITKNILVN